MSSWAAEKLLIRAAFEDVTLSVPAPGRLRYQARWRPLSAEFRALLIEHKTAILGILSAFQVDGVTVVYCATYDEAKALIAEMIADAGGKPIALDLETAPIQAERDRLATLIVERKAINAEAIAFRKDSKKAGAPQSEIDAHTEEANAKLEILDRQIDYAEGAGLDPHRAQIRLLQVYGGGQRAAVIDIAKAGTATLGLLAGASAVIHNSVFDLAFLIHRGVNLGTVHDSLQAAKLVLGKSKCALAAVVRHYHKVDLAKELQATDWSRRI